MGLKALLHETKHALLVESEQQYRQLFDNAAEGLLVFRVEEDGRGEADDLVLVDINPMQARRTRISRERLLGRRLSECDGSDERLRAYFDVVKGAVDAGRPARCEVYLRGQAAYELLSAYPAANGLWVLSATDVTELREAERALRRQEEGIRQAVRGRAGRRDRRQADPADRRAADRRAGNASGPPARLRRAF